MYNKFCPMPIGDALKITGPLTSTTKMPCKSWGIPTKYCKTGAKLRLVEGSVCSRCYACRGPISWPQSRRRQEERYEGLKHPRWVEAMASLIYNEGQPYFRWFDSGDLQSKKHYTAIAEIAELLPHITFWLPTKEARFVSGTRPANLIVRVTSAMINAGPMKGPSRTASVERASKEQWAKKTSTKTHVFCTSELRDGKCGVCRACWDVNVKHITYRQR